MTEDALDIPLDVEMPTPWTKGPWEWRDEGGSSDPALIDKDGDIVATGWYSDSGVSVGPDDARLISKAPEMAELLERWLQAPSTAWSRNEGTDAATRSLLAYIKGEG